MLQPERDLQPADMQITTADMNDMTPSDDMMDGMSPMAKTGIGVDPTAVAAPARTHIALASITSPSQSPVATELVTLADLRRRLRNRNADVLSQHQELHLHRSAELLNIVKSSF